MAPHSHSGRPPLDEGLRSSRGADDPPRRVRRVDEEWFRPGDHVTPSSLVFFFGAAIAFQQSTLAGGSSTLFRIGAVCLTVSLGLPLVSRLRARRRGALDSTPHAADSAHEAPP